MLSVFRDRDEALLFLTGVNLMLLNFIMVRHVSIALRQAETAVVVFSLAYFMGISLGYFVSDSVSRSMVRVLLPVFLLVQLALVVLVQPFHYLVAKMGGAFIALSLVFIIVMLGVTSLHAVFLPMMVEQGNRGLRRCYSVEAAGSVTGLLAAGLLAAVSQTVLLGGYILAFLGVAWLIRLERDKLTVLAVAAAAYLALFPFLDQVGATWFYKRWFDGKNIQGLAYTTYTPYHKIEVLSLPANEYMLLLNGQQQFARWSHFHYSYYVAEYPARLLKSRDVCLLGCGSMSTVGRIGDFVDRVRIVDLDPTVFRTCKRFFKNYNRLDQLDNWHFTADDAKHFVATTDERFDLILHDIPPAESRQVALTYTREFFTQVKRCLKPEGVFSISSLTPFDSRSRYGKRMVATLTSVFDYYFVLAYAGDIYFYGGNEAMPRFTRTQLYQAVDHPGRDKVKVYRKEEVDAIVGGARIITMNNVGDLIYEYL